MVGKSVVTNAALRLSSLRLFTAYY